MHSLPSSILSRWQRTEVFYLAKILSCCSVGLVLNSFAEIPSPAPTLDIHVPTLPSFLSSLITPFSSLNAKVSLSFSIILQSHKEYNLSFAPKNKLLLANIKTQNFWTHSIHSRYMSRHCQLHPLFSSYCVTKLAKLLSQKPKYFPRF